MGRDLLTFPYGRFYHLPRYLARKRHEVDILLCSYKSEPEENNYSSKDGINWHSVSPLRGNLFRYYNKSFQLARKIHPDWIIGFSDTYFGILAQHIASRTGSRSLIDAYDNFESYIPWCKPLHLLWRRALAEANLVTAAGPQLAELMGRNRSGKPTLVLPMAADPTWFNPRDKMQCRQDLGLPLDKKIIGYCGSIHPSRGIDVLFAAYRILRQKNLNIELILTGRLAPNLDLPTGTRWLGYLPDEQMPCLLNSLDVLAVINKLSSFGNFSYPVKLYEAMCCKIPVVATATPATRWILEKFPDRLVTAGESVELSNKIMTALQHDRIDYGHQKDWEDQATLIEQALEKKI